MSTRVKHIIKKLWSLPPKDREVWLEAIMGEFDEDFSHSKWREGYEQGKSEGAWVGQQLKDADKIRQELNRPVVPQFVAGWIEYVRGWNKGLLYALANASDEVLAWLCVDKLKRQELFACAWLYGYEVEEEKRYVVKLKGVNGSSRHLKHNTSSDVWYMGNYGVPEDVEVYHPHKELQAAGFGWVFDCPGIEIEEVE